MSDGTFPPPVQQYNHCSRSHCHPTEPGEASVYFLSLTGSRSASWARAQDRHIGHIVSDVLFLVWLAVYSGGPVEGLLVSSSLWPPTSTRGPQPHVSPNIWKKRGSLFYLSSVKDVLKTVCRDTCETGWIVKMMCCSLGFNIYSVVTVPS